MLANRKQRRPAANVPAAAVVWQSIRQGVDLRELATGIFVVGMALLGSRLSPALFAEASNILLSQVMFEMPMAILAVGAGGAIKHSTAIKRTASICFGIAAVAAAGILTAISLDAPAAIAAGAWLIVARATPPSGVSWFSIEHCRAIEVTAGTAWACLVVAILLLFTLASMTPAQGGTKTPPGFVYAIAWGGYYLGLAFLLPYVRRRFAAPKERRASPRH
jgi:hypothetical protein